MADDTAAKSLDAAHAALRDRADLQFVFDAAKPRETHPPPDWLVAFFRWLGDLLSVPAAVMPYLFWGAAALVVGAILYLVAREMGGLNFRRHRATPSAVPLYRPDVETANTLLADADALAAEGRFEEAVHVLLLRSVEDMRRWRSDVVQPAFTSRELAGLALLPAGARTAFAAMARLVEQSLFGGRPVGRDGFEASRKAYADFALTEPAA